LDKKAEKQHQLAKKIAEKIESHIDAKYSYLNMTDDQKRALKLE